MKVTMGRLPSKPFVFNISADEEDMRAIYFALRAHRDTLHKSLMKATVNTIEADDMHDIIELDENGDFPIVDVNRSLTNLHKMVNVSFDGSIEYEELMFLHEQLFNVNRLLFDIMENHLAHDKIAVHNILNVD